MTNESNQRKIADHKKRLYPLSSKSFTDLHTEMNKNASLKESMESSIADTKQKLHELLQANSDLINKRTELTEALEKVNNEIKINEEGMQINNQALESDERIYQELEQQGKDLEAVQ